MKVVIPTTDLRAEKKVFRPLEVNLEDIIHVLILPRSIVGNILLPRLLLLRKELSILLQGRYLHPFHLHQLEDL